LPINPTNESDSGAVLYLIAASLLWAFSFGLIKGHLTHLDPVLVAAVRLSLAALVFIPFVLKKPLGRRLTFLAMGLGAVQFGLMYILYLSSYQYLAAWMVALFTIFTPFFVVLIGDALAVKVRGKAWLAALLAVAGAMIVVGFRVPDAGQWRGILLLQLANLAFASGQVLFPRLKARAGGNEATLLGWMYLGGALLTGLLATLMVPDVQAGWNQTSVLVVLYLGLLPTGLGFYLWNRGTIGTSLGILAVANNLKVPLSVLVVWVFFGEDARYLPALAGMSLMVAALFWSGRQK
jgi:drug/metabolite transporter (DMT)-like permease